MFIEKTGVMRTSPPLARHRLDGGGFLQETIVVEMWDKFLFVLDFHNLLFILSSPCLRGES